MSIVAFPGAVEGKAFDETMSEQPTRPVVSIRRRGSLAQGRALESLGHAVEYLVDSRMFEPGVSDGRAEQEAVQILMRCSRAVFGECPEVLSVRRRLRRWVSRRLAGDARLRRAG